MPVFFPGAEPDAEGLLPTPPRGNAARRAASALEFAVVASLFFVLILGLIELGRCLMVQHLLTNAARQGCRVAVIEGKTMNDVTTVVNNLLNDQGISGATTTVQVNGITADASTAGPADKLSVSVSISANNVSWVPAAQYCFGTITGSYSLRRE
jgi:Flp pilus assembly protein TadG